VFTFGGRAIWRLNVFTFGGWHYMDGSMVYCTGDIWDQELGHAFTGVDGTFQRYPGVELVMDRLEFVLNNATTLSCKNNCFFYHVSACF
jgi:hypothetical protein